MKRAIVLVLDGCGAGAAPDCQVFGDHPSVNTLANVWREAGGIDAPELIQAGFFAAAGIESSSSHAHYGRLRELSQGKDSVTGHWEMMGIVTKEPFPTYPNGFPPDLMDAFASKSGLPTLGNKAASGTEIIAELGSEHISTGYPIVYTSADSVFQIAAHEDVIAIDKLYELCQIARDVCTGKHLVQRVIARPFIGRPGAFVRTKRRKDFAAPPPPNLIDEIGEVFGIGVVPELFAGRGFRAVRRTQQNSEHEEMLLSAMETDARFIFANFEDFDMLYGHRNDPAGFAHCLERFDETLANVKQRLTKDDLLILTADHGNDPTDVSTDHSREYVPFCLLGAEVHPKQNGTMAGLFHVGKTVADWLEIDWQI